MARRYIGTVSTVGAVLTAGVVLALFSTTPVSAGPIGVTVWFMALLVGLSCWLSLGFLWLGRILQPALSSVQQTANAWRRGLMLGGFTTIILALSSLHQLNPRDAILLAILIILLEFYMVAKG